ncbi:thiamine diphosphate-binding protein [Phlyctochytrium arcticum]|nr:thiamine diphosphate-binding protein [Phlyctochytrium arcticum]
MASLIRPYLLKGARRGSTALLSRIPPSCQRLSTKTAVLRQAASAAAAATPPDAAHRVNFPGANESYYTEQMEFVRDYAPLPTYRVLDQDGNVMDEAQDPQLSKEVCRKMYTSMLTLNAMDLILYEAQRQGRISFYMTSYGEEATHMGSAAALTLDDVIYGQYREAGVLMYRGFTLEQFMNQCYSNELDFGKGRQMPVHYGSRELNFQTISSPLGTQLPQAAGSAYALKRSGKDACVVCFFGEGAASEGDFHAALNIAATTESPVLFFCRNNGYAISTPAKEQYRGDGIASRGHGYGMDTVRVDGNDALAVYNVVKEARRRAITESRPILIEALTYRVGHHSTSDDSSAYRSKTEVSDWMKQDSPISRFRKYLEKKNYWSEAEEQSFKKDIRSQILKAFAAGEKVKKPSVKHLFTDVYAGEQPWNLKEQKVELERLMEKFPKEYDDSAHGDK